MLNDITAIIPCFNSETTIAKVVQETSIYIKDIIVVDDGSIDASAKISKENGAIVVTLPKNTGVGAAIKKGIQTSFELNNNHIVTIDADGAHNPKDISKLLKSHKTNNNILTIGNRWEKYKSTIPSSKWWANQFASSLINKIASTKIPDVACGLRVFDKKFAQQMLSPEFPNRFGFVYHSVFLAKEMGKIGSENIDVRYNANIIMATNVKELRDLLRACLTHCGNNHILKTINKLLYRTSRMRKITIKIQDIEEYIVLYPLIEQNVYIFQRQEQNFLFDETELIVI